MAELPSGTLTFLFTDLEGSTALWEAQPDLMRDAVARHDELLTATIGRSGGQVVKTTGDGIVAVFANASEAVAGARGCQQALDSEEWPLVIKARMGLYTGEAQPVDGDYHAPVLNRAARVMSAGHGGQVLLASSTASLVQSTLPADTDLAGLGEHRLRDLDGVEELYQLVHPDLVREFPVLRTLDALPGNLPRQGASFVGRGELIRWCVEALQTSDVVTLTGVGGVGKTRLAIQVAAEVLPEFSGGAWLCELAAVRDSDRVAEAIAAVFGTAARPNMGLEESLVAFLRDEEVLLVLDNCEHVLRSVARLAAEVRGACPGVKILATSREGMSIAGEQILAVAPLDIPTIDADAGEVEAAEAVQLFVARARSQRTDFHVDDTNRSDVAALCQRLDGVPLAIELAAARINMMSPAELLLRLDQRFRLLSGGDRAGIERHQTLRAAVDWSYDLLSGAEQRLLARMSVFSGGWTLGAAEAVCVGDGIDDLEALDLLGGLVSRSLVVAEPGVDTRYRMLETIRQYAEERLAETGETDRWRARHADYFIDFLARTVPELLGPHQPDAQERFLREEANLKAAMAFAVQTNDLDRAIDLLLQTHRTNGDVGRHDVSVRRRRGSASPRGRASPSARFGAHAGRLAGDLSRGLGQGNGAR